MYEARVYGNDYNPSLAHHKPLIAELVEFYRQTREHALAISPLEVTELPDGTRDYRFKWVQRCGWYDAGTLLTVHYPDGRVVAGKLAHNETRRDKQLLAKGLAPTRCALWISGTVAWIPVAYTQGSHRAHCGKFDELQPAMDVYNSIDMRSGRIGSTIATTSVRREYRHLGVTLLDVEFGTAVLRRVASKDYTTCDGYSVKKVRGGYKITGNGAYLQARRLSDVRREIQTLRGEA